LEIPDIDKLVGSGGDRIGAVGHGVGRVWSRGGDEDKESVDGRDKDECERLYPTTMRLAIEYVDTLRGVKVVGGGVRAGFEVGADRRDGGAGAESTIWTHVWRSLNRRGAAASWVR
jgi:hypothetical protein